MNTPYLWKEKNTKCKTHISSRGSPRIGKEITVSLCLSSCILNTFSIHRKNHQWQPSPTFYYSNPHLGTTACCCVPALLSYACNFNKDLSPSIWYPTLLQRTDSMWSRKSIKLMLSGFGDGGRWSRCLFHLPCALTCTNSKEGTTSRVAAMQKRNQRIGSRGSQAEHSATMACSWEKGKCHTAMFKQK